MSPDLRDRFAMAALQGLLASEGRDNQSYLENGAIEVDSLASDAYAIADAMIRERKKGSR